MDVDNPSTSSGCPRRLCDRESSARGLASAVGNEGVLFSLGAHDVNVHSDIPAVIGRYKVLQSLGKGNFAQVRLAKHKVAKTKVAIKIVAKRRLDEEALRKLCREVDILKKLNHPHIIESGGTLYIVTEYASGGELFNLLLTRGRMCEPEARKIFRQASCALAYCHSVGVAHRDLKAENLLLDANGDVKLIDFGFGQHHIEGALMNTWCGSPPYAAPELFKGVEYDGTKADIWSLGVILYVLVTGGFPFPGNCIEKLKLAVLGGYVVIPYWVSVECADLIRRMLEVSPRRRLAMPQVVSHRWFTDPSDWSPKWAALVERSLSGSGDDPDNCMSGRQPLTQSSSLSATGPDAANYPQFAAAPSLNVNLAVLAYMQQQMCVPADVVKSSVQYARFDELHGCYRILCDKLARQTSSSGCEEKLQLQSNSAHLQAADRPAGPQQGNDESHAQTTDVMGGLMQGTRYSRRMTLPAISSQGLFGSRRGSRGSISKGTASPDGGPIMAVIATSDFAKLSINSSPEQSDEDESDSDSERTHGALEARSSDTDRWLSRLCDESEESSVPPHGNLAGNKRRRPSLPVTGPNMMHIQLPTPTTADFSVAASAWLSPGSLARPALIWTNPDTLSSLAGGYVNRGRGDACGVPVDQRAVPFPLVEGPNKYRRLQGNLPGQHHFEEKSTPAGSSNCANADRPSVPVIVTDEYGAAPLAHNTLRSLASPNRRASDGGAFIQLTAPLLNMATSPHSSLAEMTPVTSDGGSSDANTLGGEPSILSAMGEYSGRQLGPCEQPWVFGGGRASASRVPFPQHDRQQGYLPQRSSAHRLSVCRPSIASGVGGLRRSSSPLQLTQTQLAHLERTFNQAARLREGAQADGDAALSDAAADGTGHSPQTSPNVDRPPSRGAPQVLSGGPLDMIMEHEPPPHQRASPPMAHACQADLGHVDVLEGQMPQPLCHLYCEAPSMHVDSVCMEQSRMQHPASLFPPADCTLPGAAPFEHTVLMSAMSSAEVTAHLADAARRLGADVFDFGVEFIQPEPGGDDRMGRDNPAHTGRRLSLQFGTAPGEEMNESRALKVEVGVSETRDAGALVRFSQIQGDSRVFELLISQLTRTLHAV